MYYSLLSLILLNHLHHRKFDYCLISSLYLPIVFPLCNMLTDCQRVNKHINDQSPLIPPDWLRFQEKHSLRGIYNTNQRAADAEQLDFQRQTYIICCPYKYFQHNADSSVSRAKHAAKNLQREITLLPVGARQNSMDFFNVGFILIRY